MRVMDNSPIDVPAVGRLVKETYAVGQLADCCLYVLSSNASSMVEKAKEVFDGLMKSMGADKLLNKYDFEVLDRLPVLDNHPMLGNAIKEERCQFVMSLYTPSKSDKQYLLLKSLKLGYLTYLKNILTSYKLIFHLILVALHLTKSNLDFQL